MPVLLSREKAEKAPSTWVAEGGESQLKELKLIGQRRALTVDDYLVQ
jgi:hypothetical protein